MSPVAVSHLKYVSERLHGDGKVGFRVKVPGFNEITVATATEVKSTLRRFLGTEKFALKPCRVRKQFIKSKKTHKGKCSIPQLLTRIGLLVPLGEEGLLSG